MYRWVGTDAVRHLFRVAAGLDSMMLGEAEILGQLRTAYGQALEHGATGAWSWNRAFQGALEVGKRGCERRRKWARGPCRSRWRA